VSISAIIPVYNGEQTLSRAIDSVLHQTAPVDEIILIDDGSTDGTAQIARKYGDAIRYFHYENGGLPTARNRGVALAQCEWINFLDADDEWLPRYVESHTRLHRQNPEIKWSSCHSERVNVVSGARSTMSIPEVLLREIELTGTVSFFDAYMRGLFGLPSGVMVQRPVYDEVGQFDQKMRNGQDRDMWGRIGLRYGRIAVCPDVCWRYYEGGHSLSRTGRMYRDLQLRGVCRNMHSALEIGPEAVSRYRPYAKRLFLEYLMRVAAKDCIIEPTTIEDAKHLFPLTIGERWILRIIRALPTPIALKVVAKLRACS
jgi:glycosyltransferase involved in cell wall biosynthesis